MIDFILGFLVFWGTYLGIIILLLIVLSILTAIGGFCIYCGIIYWNNFKV